MKDLLRFLFKGDIGPTVHVRRIKIAKAGAVVPNDLDIRFKIVKFSSWVLAAILLIMIVGVFLLLLAGKVIPDFIPPMITAVIGYFGGVISAFFGLKKG